MCRFSAMTLCNLSTHADCKATLVSLHGLPPLIEMLEGESDLVKRYAAMTLCNLSTLAINQVRSGNDDAVSMCCSQPFSFHTTYA